MNFHALKARSASQVPIPQLGVQCDNLLTLPQAAGTLAISKRTLERLIARGVFPRPVKIGRASRVSHSDIESFLEQLHRQRGDKVGTS